MALAMIMQPLMCWLRRIRWPNLALATFCLLTFRFILSMNATKAGVELQLSDSGFIALWAALCCIMGAGYLWNDLEDLFTDRINRPTAALVPNSIEFSRVRNAANILAVTGGVIALISAGVTGLWQWLWLYPVAMVVLLCYTKLLKPLGLVGNAAIALLIGMVPLLLVIPEWSWVGRTSDNSDPSLLGVFILFSLLALFGNLFRELVKDLEDLPGDSATGIRTLPIRLGIPGSLAITASIGFTLALLLALVALINPWNLGAGPAFLSLAFLQCAIVLILLRTKEASAFRRISIMAKWHQAAGLLLALGLGLDLAS